MQSAKRIEQGPEAPRYDFTPLVAEDKDLQQYARQTKTGAVKLDLSTYGAKHALTSAILRHYFNIRIILPCGQLIPTIPNRVQYLTWASSLLGSSALYLPHTVLDIGTGPACIYPLLGSRLFPKWSFVATDTDENAVHFAKQNIVANGIVSVSVHQTGERGRMLSEKVMAAKPNLTVCNPPFHAELPTSKTTPGTVSQLVTQGGELGFLQRLANESTQSFGVAWFTSLVGRKVDLPAIVRYLRSAHVSALHVKTVELSQGGRTTRWAVAWSFGQEKSEVELLRDHGSKWRLVFAVRPGRSFANQLSSDDIAACFSSMLQNMDWVASDEAHGMARYGNLFHGSLQTRLEQTKLEVNVMNGLVAGEFHVHVKVAECGLLTADELGNLGDSLADGVANLLGA